MADDRSVAPRPTSPARPAVTMASLEAAAVVIRITREPVRPGPRLATRGERIVPRYPGDTLVDRPFSERDEEAA